MKLGAKFCMCPAVFASGQIQNRKKWTLTHLLKCPRPIAGSSPGFQDAFYDPNPGKEAWTMEFKPTTAPTASLGRKDSYAILGFGLLQPAQAVKGI
jgi:hypothetical protein